MISLTYQGPEQETDTSGVLNAKMLPWLDASLAGMNSGIRRLDNELIVAFVNFPSAGCCKRQQATLCAFPGDFTCPFVSTGVCGSACDAQQGGRSPKLQVLSIHSVSFLKPNLFYDLCPFKIRINDLSFYPYAFEDRSQG